MIREKCSFVLWAMRKQDREVTGVPLTFAKNWWTPGSNLLVTELWENNISQLNVSPPKKSRSQWKQLFGPNPTRRSVAICFPRPISLKSISLKFYGSLTLSLFSQATKTSKGFPGHKVQDNEAFPSILGIRSLGTVSLGSIILQALNHDIYWILSSLALGTDLCDCSLTS